MMKNGDTPATAITIKTSALAMGQGRGGGFFPPRDSETTYKGLTKREHFAAMAMQGLMGNSGLNKDILKTAFGEDKSVSEVLAISSIEMADALLAALEKS